jgi:thiamine pyrophosphokinase
MSRFTILLGGEMVATARLRRQIQDSRVIAADSGIVHAEALSLTPELWTGDFDSVDEAMRGRHGDVPTRIYPAEKDLTDGEIAIEAAIEMGATSLVLVGAFGGPRADHAFLHLAAAIGLAERGMETLITSGTQEGVPLLPGRMALDFEHGTLFSVLAFSDLAGLTLEGVKWPLDERFVPFGSSLTLSNEVRGDMVATLGSGRAMVVAHLAGDDGSN